MSNPPNERWKFISDTSDMFLHCLACPECKKRWNEIRTHMKEIGFGKEEV